MKTDFEKMSESELQTLARRLIDNDIFVNQTALVAELLNRQIICFEDVDNHTISEEEFDRENMKELGYESYDDFRDHGKDVKEIYEWILIGDYMASLLSSHNEIILKSDYGTWWGRTTSGQGYVCDYVLQKIAQTTYKTYKRTI